MNKEIIKQIILTADDEKYLTNGETFAKTVVMPENADIYAWREIPEDEYYEIIKSLESSNPEA